MDDLSNTDGMDRFVGTGLLRVAYERCSLKLDFIIPGPESEGARFLALDTLCDVCTNTGEMFDAASEYDTFRTDILVHLYACLEERVKAFVALGRDRACRLDFESKSFFFWADAGELPDPMIDVREYHRGEKIGEWGIDDV